MSEEEKKAIEWLKYLQETRKEQIRQQAWVGTNTFDAIDEVLNLIEKQQAEIEKKDKIIDEMAEFLEDELTIDTFCIKENCYADEYVNGHCQKCLNCIIEYFTKKVEGE